MFLEFYKIQLYESSRSPCVPASPVKKILHVRQKFTVQLWYTIYYTCTCRIELVLQKQTTGYSKALKQQENYCKDASPSYNLQNNLREAAMHLYRCKAV